MFDGFSPETVDFLWGIRMNNDRRWFLEHKSDYVQYLYEPMKELGKELFKPYLDRPGNILKVSRIYRDARLHHPVPYKESLWICIRQDVQWWMENPCLFFEIRPEGISYGFAFLRPRVTTLEAIRQDIAARPRKFLKLMKTVQEATGMPVEAELYKRPKEAPDAKLAPYWAWKRDICCIRNEPFSEETFGPELAKRVGDFLESLQPLYAYFNQFKV